MAIGHESSTVARTTAAVNTLTTSFTVTLANLLVVCTAIRSATDANRPVTGITWNGAALTKLRGDQWDPDDFGTEIWYLVNPAAGTFNVVTTTTGNIGLNLSHVIMGLTGVNTSSPVDTTGATANGSGGSATTTVTTGTNNSWVVDVAYCKVDAGVTVSGSGHTQRQNSNGSGSNDSTAVGTTLVATAGSNSPAWTGSGGGDTWNISAAAFKESASSGQTITPGFISAGSQLFSPTFAFGAVTVTPGTIAAGSQLFAPTLTSNFNLTPARIDSTAQLFAPTLTPGAVTVTPGTIASTEQVFAPDLGGGITITPGHLASTEQVFAPTFAVGAITVTPGFLASTEQVFQPTLLGGDVVASKGQRPMTGVG